MNSEKATGSKAPNNKLTPGRKEVAGTFFKARALFSPGTASYYKPRRNANATNQLKKKLKQITNAIKFTTKRRAPNRESVRRSRDLHETKLDAQDINNNGTKTEICDHPDAIVNESSHKTSRPMPSTPGIQKWLLNDVKINRILANTASSTHTHEQKKLATLNYPRFLKYQKSPKASITYLITKLMMGQI
uniref:Uncharacterized protein n=1 Tax=Glossina austeni TaxID=7395 RepID=A0A1A9UZ64_GLOAU